MAMIGKILKSGFDFLFLFFLFLFSYVSILSKFSCFHLLSEMRGKMGSVSARLLKPQTPSHTRRKREAERHLNVDEKGREKKRSGKEFKTRLWLTICLVGFYYDYLLSFSFLLLALPKGLWCR